ncbi:ADP-ribosylglycohydrolase family protein [Mucilaginibacter ginsenosidivorax]|uniref:ADP-ribosylglycohydrolase family protein n=1 Tax=Mucilaginibacter ginsenosidivorax TaxID=862126 RepID=A0A5B8W2W6_9SPHI|nr:ADP-ribosylglycohydrolase family protein [Mucilaginibacter ginsenosidivorax]QEC78121.1 ADP-ribosylglycohydrolase family protein [Mucilaginibacter ginsenosidivorax]
MSHHRNFCKDILFGVAVGDAVGVPAEFKSREEIAKKPVTDMVGFGTHDQLPGTWSDDSSLTFCLAESLTNGYNIHDIANNFVRWRCDNFWTARGEVFDVGITTHEAIERIVRGVQPNLAGGFDSWSNGNGSLMRILPLLVYTKDLPITERFAVTKDVSSITHGHIRSVVACFYYLEFAGKLLSGRDLRVIYDEVKQEVTAFLDTTSINKDEIKLFDRLLAGNIYELAASEISSSGYVLHTLEASIWCLLTTTTYKEAVLKAVNLGLDTDTTGAVTGGLAALYYSFETIPEDWVLRLALEKDINDLAARLAKIL